MKALPVAPRFRVSPDGYDRHAVDAFVRDTAEELGRVRKQIAELEAALIAHQRCDATIQDLQGRIAAREHDIDLASLILQNLESWLESAIPTVRESRRVLGQADEQRRTSAAPTPNGGRSSESQNPQTRGTKASRPGRTPKVPLRSRRIAYTLAAVFVATAAVATVMLRISPWNQLTANHAAIVTDYHMDPPPATQRATRVDSPEPPAVAQPVPGPTAQPEPRPAFTPNSATRGQPARGGLAITVTAHDRCWLRATLDGRRARERLLQRGEDALLNAREEVLLRVGNAGAISLTINGRVARSLGRPGQVVTTRITQANYAQLIGPSPRR